MGSASKKTSSISTAEKAEGTHVFTIDGYSLKNGMGVGEFIRSASFAVGGHEWAIRFYPDGATKDPKDLVAIAVELMSKTAEARAFFDVGVLDLVSGMERLGPVLKKPILFKGSGGRCKVKVVVELPRLHLEELGFIQNDRLVIQCVLTVLKESQVYETTRCSEIEVPPSNIKLDLNKLLEEKVGADVTFIVGGKIFEAHKIVLAARSPVFKAEFYGPMMETRARRVTIKDMQPDVFEALLHFIYNDSLPDLDDLEGNEHCEMIRHLLVAADRYAVDRLKLMCQNILGKELDEETVVTTLALADQHNCSKLKVVCNDFIKSLDKMDDVMKTEGYEIVKRSRPSILVDMFEKRVRKA